MSVIYKPYLRIQEKKMNAPNSATFAFSSWPPNLTDAQLFELTSYAATYALSHGLLYLPPHSPSANVQAPAPTPTAAIHAPLSIFPAPFPRQLFEGARKLQRLYNVLYAKIAMDEEFLDQVMGAELGVGRVDDFVGTLWAGWQRVREERHAERRKEVCVLCSVHGFPTSSPPLPLSR